MILADLVLPVDRVRALRAGRPRLGVLRNAVKALAALRAAIRGMVAATAPRNRLLYVAIALVIPNVFPGRGARPMLDRMSATLIALATLLLARKLAVLVQKGRLGNPGAPAHALDDTMMTALKRLALGCTSLLMLDAVDLFTYAALVRHDYLRI